METLAFPGSAFEHFIMFGCCFLGIEYDKICFDDIGNVFENGARALLTIGFDALFNDASGSTLP